MVSFGIYWWNSCHSQDEKHIYQPKKFPYPTLLSLLSSPFFIPRQPLTSIWSQVCFFRILYKENHILYPLLTSFTERCFYVVCINSFFLFVSKWCSPVWLYHNLFVHSPIDEHLGFQFRVITKKAVRNIHVKVLI